LLIYVFFINVIYIIGHLISVFLHTIFLILNDFLLTLIISFPSYVCFMLTLLLPHFSLFLILILTSFICYFFHVPIFFHQHIFPFSYYSLIFFFLVFHLYLVLFRT
jgi:hypothetical protein